jgi:hypothetical protein
VVGVVGEQGEERGLVDGQAADQVGAPRREPEGDGAPGRDAGDVSGGEAEVFQQDRQVGDVLLDAALPGRALALAVAAAVIGQDAEALGEDRQHGVPAGVVAQGAVDQHQRRAGAAGARVEEADAVDGGGRHGDPPFRREPARNADTVHVIPAPAAAQAGIDTAAPAR